MNLNKQLFFFMIILITSSFNHAFAQNRTCIPQCRAGFTCYEGQCISKCNPTCSQQEQCTDEGTCITKTKAVSQKDDHKTIFSASLGTVLAGEVYVGGYQIDTYVGTEQGFIVRSMVDRFVSPILSVGLYLNYIAFDLEMSGSASIVTPGITIKTLIQMSKSTDLRLGIALGYQRSSATISTATVDDIQGFDIAPILELSTKLDQDMNVLFSVSAFSQPSGGNDDYEVSWSPIFFLAGGLEFGG